LFLTLASGISTCFLSFCLLVWFVQGFKT
jgi:hypothetical protein